jgi:hypothetical protein
VAAKSRASADEAILKQRSAREFTSLAAVFQRRRQSPARAEFTDSEQRIDRIVNWK